MKRFRSVAILTALVIAIAACTGPTPPEEEKVTLTVNVAGTGTGAVTFESADGDSAEGSTEHDKDSVVTLVATADAGSTFAGWMGDCTGTAATCQVTMDSDKEVVATFDAVPEEVQLSVAFTGSNGSGRVVQAELGIDCSYDAGAGTSGPDCGPVTASATTAYEFEATPEAGIDFIGWGGDADAQCDDSETTCVVTPDKNPFVVVAILRDPVEPEPVTGSVRIASTEDDGFEWLGDASGATGVATDVPGNTYNDLRQIGLSYLHRYGVEIVSGFAFRDLDIPQGAQIQEAYIQFTSIVRSSGSGPSGSYNPTDGNEVTVVIEVQDSLNPAGIPKRDPTEPYENNLTGRTKVAGLDVNWNIPNWPTRSQATADQRTPNLAALLQALVDKPEWTAQESDVMFLIRNADDTPETGWRQVADFSEVEGEEGQEVPEGTFAAVLHFTYTLP